MQDLGFRAVIAIFRRGLRIMGISFVFLIGIALIVMIVAGVALFFLKR